MFPGSPGLPGSPGACSPGSPGSSRSLDDLLTCPVCLDSFKDPKTLQCLHSFCSKCLENCRRPYRRDVTCPICKKVTNLTPLGVQGLQNDFRIQQIRDILINRPNSPSGAEDGTPPVAVDSKVCDLCKCQQRKTAACTHCIQCYMYFCNSCTSKHNSNPIFESHHLINMGESNGSEVLFCKSHREHPVRYFCKTCNGMLCTICTMEHDPNHNPEPLEKGIIEKYRVQLKESLRTVKTKLSEVNTKTKYLETLKQSHQRAMYHAQAAIRERTEGVVSQIKQYESNLLQEVQDKIDSRMREYGLETLSEFNFHKANMESLYSDIQNVIQGSPQQCLVAYEDIIMRMKSIAEASVPSVHPSKSKSILKFIPSQTETINNVIGSLQECSISDESEDDDTSPQSPRRSPRNSFLSTSPKSPVLSRSRMSSILSALSPGRKNEIKIGKVKAFSNQPDRSDTKSPPNTINVDDLVGTSEEMTGSTQTSSSQLSPTSITQSTSDASIITAPAVRAIQYRARPVFSNDQIGGWPGKITSPSGVAFLPTGSIIVAECENRLQTFNISGQSVKIIGWGKVKPQGVTVSADCKIVITDKKDRCVKVYHMDGECSTIWGKGFFSSPSGIAVSASGKFVVTDVDRHCVSIHQPDGSVITQFGNWGSGDYQFNNPSHVTIDSHENIIISDSCNGCIKVFDKNGVFVHKFSLQSNKQTQLRRPLGVAVDHLNNVIVADRDNHRISMFTPEGRFLRHLLTKQDNLKYPCDVAVHEQYIAVVETHSGFLTKDPHHAVKLYELS